MADKKDQNHKFHLTIVDPDRVIFEDDIKQVFAPGSIQEIAILPDHTPLYSQLIKGEVRITLLDDSTKNIPIDGGVIRVKSNMASIIIGF